MKSEIKLYAGISFFIVVLFLLQNNQAFTKYKANASVANTLEIFNQLFVNTECNLFLIKGKEEGILLEGPVERLSNLETEYNKGCITVSGKSKKMMTSILDYFIPGEHKVNIYITIDDIKNVNILHSMRSPEIKYKDEDVIGLILKEGEQLIIESNKIKNCV